MSDTDSISDAAYEHDFFDDLDIDDQVIAEIGTIASAREIQDSINSMLKGTAFDSRKRKSLNRKIERQKKRVD